MNAVTVNITCIYLCSVIYIKYVVEKLVFRKLYYKLFKFDAETSLNGLCRIDFEASEIMC